MSVSATEPAWNGHTIPGSTTPAPFTPFYVPPGAKAYDSSSPLVLYTGKWRTVFSAGYIHQSLSSTMEPHAAISFTFTGTGIEWFGNCDRHHGISLVFIDGLFTRNVDAYCDHDKPLKQQRIFWNFDLPYGHHTIKIINTAKRHGSTRPTICDIDAFVVTRGTNAGHQFQLSTAFLKGNYPAFLATQTSQVLDTASEWTLTQQGTTGVHAMQLAIISNSHAIIIDKVEHNPLTISGHPAWGALYNLNTHAVKPLAMQSNSFCAGGTFLGNGTLVSVGGNPVVDGHTASADFGDLDGLQAVRIFEPCDSESPDGCDMYEHHSRIRLASPRWYNTVVRIGDGSAMIVGGSKKGGWINNATVNNPTLEYFPPKGIHGSNGLPINLPFLVDTLNSNLFPIAFSLPDGKVFMAANRDAMIYDWKNNQERRLPQIPNGVRVTYPMTGTGLLLPLSPENGYRPEILLCGGSDISDTKPSYEISSQDPASPQCSRMVLTNEGIAAGWQVESMPQARIMPDAVLLPTGEVFIVNGAGSGISGYGNVRDQVGSSNADNPVLTPVLYNPLAAPGSRFSSAGLPSSSIPRLYHSVATLTPAGDIMVAGSNPNLDRSELQYGTEYRVEWFSPPYMKMERPEIVGKVEKLEFGAEIKVQVKVPGGNTGNVKVALMDLGFVTHAIHANMRLVYLVCSVAGDTLTVTGPPSGNIYPPGPGWIYFLVDGVPSKGVKVMVGDGRGPPVDEAALENLLQNSVVDQYEKSKGVETEDVSE
ncbi:putative copper radical oxidase [Lyophyllum shimeji]|uniref:Copper radical oxidase n=1 Tax=Lyophyllum shimeji TaxID=47721 RepID=A0A9P3PFY5_LYOSH|nr:putative copper radical oxidase [Lyophyllum shimeji]